MGRSSGDVSHLLFSSPSSTGSRFDLLVVGGGSCSRSEVRKATSRHHHQHQQQQQQGRQSCDGSSARRRGGSAPDGCQQPSVACGVARGRDGYGSGGDGGAPSLPLPPAGASTSATATPVSIPSRPPFRRLQPQPFSHILVCDFEATCESGSVDYPHEIIEFPVVVLDTASLQVVAEFHSYVRPVMNPKLTRFCTELTGITQQMVDAAPTLPVVVERFGVWLREVLYPLCRAWRARHAPESGAATASSTDYCSALATNLRAEQRHFVYDDRTEAGKADIPLEMMACFATDGPWDMQRFMYKCSVLRGGVEFPPLFYRYINVRRSFCEHFKCRQIKLTHMLKRLHMSFEGQRHSGIADTRNITRVLAELFACGYRVHHVSCIKYAHRGDAFLEDNIAAQRLLAEYGEDDGGHSRGHNGSHAKGARRSHHGGAANANQTRNKKRR